MEWPPLAASYPSPMKVLSTHHVEGVEWPHFAASCPATPLVAPREVGADPLADPILATPLVAPSPATPLADPILATPLAAPREVGADPLADPILATPLAAPREVSAAPLDAPCPATPLAAPWEVGAHLQVSLQVSSPREVPADPSHPAPLAAPW